MLDMNRRVQVGEGLEATDEHGVVLAASLADQGLRSGKQVGLVVQGEKLTWLPPRGGEGRRLEILRALALVRRGDNTLSHLLSQVGPDLGRSTSLIIVTPDPGPTWVSSLVPLMRLDIVPTVLLLDRNTFQPAASPADGARAGVRPTKALLSALGIGHHVISRDILDRSEMEPGKRGRWEWRVLGTGHAVPVRKPQETDWKVLS
jgi:uncharacterized protein (DUF58 family)